MEIAGDVTYPSLSPAYTPISNLVMLTLAGLESDL